MSDTKVASNISSENVRAEVEKKSKMNWLTFWGVVIPAYIYFFGYNAKIYFLNGLGFNAVEVSSDPAAVYHFAFHSLLFISAKAIDNFWQVYEQQFVSNLIFYICMTIFTGLTVYVTIKFIKWRESKEVGHQITKSKNVDSNGKIGALVREKSGLISIFFSILYALSNLLFTPLFVCFLLVLALIFSPAFVVGKGMAGYQRDHLRCDVSKGQKIDISPCSLLLLKDGTRREGRIMHRDSQYMYLYTEFEALTIPVEQIQGIQRERILKEKSGGSKS